MQLIKIDPNPKCNPSLGDKCPLKVTMSSSIYDARPSNLSKDQSTNFVLFRVHQGAYLATGMPISNLDTEPERDVTIEIGDSWSLTYHISAENADPIYFTLAMRRKEDGLETIEAEQDQSRRYSDLHENSPTPCALQVTFDGQHRS
jgi:hypothetical protein